MKTLLLYLFAISISYASAQSLDTGQVKSSKFSDSLDSLSYTHQGETPGVYNGRVFYGYPLIGGHAFYASKNWQKGSVLYDGVWYHDINMMYDIHKEILIVQHPTLIPIQLFSERIKQFNIGEQIFIRLNPDKDNIIRTGFYQQLTNGKVVILALRLKRIEESVASMTLEKNFLQFDFYYALKDGKYHEIKKQNSLLDLLKDKRQAIMKHLKQQDLKFRQDKEKTIVQTVQFYNQSHP